jgi:DNA-binding NarL/FixJ family response regulator
MAKSVKFIFTDDKELYRKSVLNCLQPAHGLECIGEANNGKELLSQLRSKQPDVILLDLEMPVMNGNETMSEIMRLYPEAKILILSYLHESELVNDYIRRGARGYICKDVVSGNIALLVQAIHTIHSGALFVHELSALKKSVFSPRQIQMIPLICSEMTNKEIAGELGINERSVEKQKQKMYIKTNSRSSISFLRFVFRKGLDFLERRDHRPI